MTSLFEKAKATTNSVAGFFVRKACLWLPQNTWGDRICIWLDFVRVHRRPPRRSMRISDFLYSLKTSGELLDLPRQIVSDKEHCKAFVEAIIGPSTTIPTLAVLRCPDAVDNYSYPPDCVIKPTHLSGQVIIRRNAEYLDLSIIRAWFAHSLATEGREINYRYLIPKVIVEPILMEGDMKELKIHCWQGRAKLIVMRPEEPNTIERRDRNWEIVHARGRRRQRPATPEPRPACLDSIIAAADTLAQQFSYIRVDVYFKDDRFVIGELTNVHRNMRQRFATDEDEVKYSRAIFGDDAV